MTYILIFVIVYTERERKTDRPETGKKGKKMKEIKLSELNGSTQSVKDKSPRGYVTKNTECVKVGDFVLVDNRFTLVVED